MIFSAVTSPLRLKLTFLCTQFFTPRVFSLSHRHKQTVISVIFFFFLQLITLFPLEIRHVMKVKCAANGILSWLCMLPHMCVCIRKKPNKLPVAEIQTKQEVYFALKKGCYHIPCCLCRSVYSWKCVKKGSAHCVQSGWKHEAF